MKTILPTVLFLMSSSAWAYADFSCELRTQKGGPAIHSKFVNVGSLPEEGLTLFVTNLGHAKLKRVPLGYNNQPVLALIITTDKGAVVEVVGTGLNVLQGNYIREDYYFGVLCRQFLGE